MGDKIRTDPKHPSTELNRRLIFGAEIDAGGVGAIVKAFDYNLMRTVVSKKLLPEYAQVEALRGRLIEEAQITSQLRHPHIVSVHELGVDQFDELFFTMDFIEGKTLSDVLREADLESRTRRELFRHLQIFLKVCDAVAYAHAHGIIHRDLKPSNIMVGNFGAVYVLDWGIARKTEKARLFDVDTANSHKPRQQRYLVETDSSLGTWKYMAPEQAMPDEHKIDERTDVFQLGGILYEILTHFAPYDARTLTVLKKKVRSCEIKSPGSRVEIPLPHRLSQVVMKALSRSHEDRYESVMALKEAVEAYMQLGGQFETTHFEEGAIIVKEGEPGQEAYIVARGLCTAYTERDGKRKELRKMGIGQVFGEMAILTGGIRTATVEAIRPTDLFVITAEDFDKTSKSEAWIGNFMRVLATRFREKDQRVHELEKELEELRGELDQ